MRSRAMEDLRKAVHEYLQGGESQLLLVTISQHIDTGQAEGVASLLLSQEHGEVVKTLGWDLLTLLTHHLPPVVTPSPSPSLWQLVTAIAETCSPKEMCLAFLEQLELVSTASPSLFFHLLTPLHTVFQRLGAVDGRRQMSSLRSVRSMLDRVYPSLMQQRRDEGEEEERGEGEGEGEELAPLTAAGYVVQLLEPYVDHLHRQFTSSEAPLQTFWTPLQRECVGLLLTLLGDPLVSCDLRQDGMDADNMRAVEAIMCGVVRCHCGCLQLLEHEGDTRWRPAEEEGEDGSPFGVPAVGVACFVYLVLVEEIQSSYLPSPLHPHHLLHTSLTHTLTLLHRPDMQSMLKGLALLECVLCHVSLCSLPPHTLAHNRYLNTAQSLVDVMVTCPHKHLRQRSVSLLPELIRRFQPSCRRKLYRHLLHSSGHAGVQGMLIHCVKNEVDQALNVNDVSSPFLGPEVVPLLHEILVFSPEQELLKETDRVMAALNFLRYLLIRDKRADNITGVWNMRDGVRSKFIQPLRHSLEGGKLQCRGEMEQQRQESGGMRGEAGPKVSVEVMGQQLPDITAEEKMKMLQLAEYQLDMIECVLVRVEELLD